MGRTTNFNGLTLTVADAYSALDVSRILSPTVAGLGIVGLIGESDNGAPGLHVFEGGISPQTIKKQLGSGAGADMTRLALRAGVDADIRGGASAVVFYQTNPNTQSQLNVSGVNPALVLKSKKYGSAMNLLTATIASSGGKKFLTIMDENGQNEVSEGVGGDAFAVITRIAGVTSATAKLAYVSSVLTLVLTEDSVEIMSVALTGLNLRQLKILVEKNSGWSLSIPSISNESFKISDLDMVPTAQSAIGGLNLYASTYELIQWANQTSENVTVERGVENYAVGVPSSLATTAFTGGTRGTSTNALVQSAFNALLKLRVNFVVPLFSKDNQDGSTVLMSSVIGMTKDHVTNRSSILGRSECSAMIGLEGNKSVLISNAAQINSRRVCLVGQQVYDLNIDGEMVWMPPYALAVIAAQSRAGSKVGTPLTYKMLPSSGLKQDVSWSPEEDGATMIQKGMLIAGADEDNTLRFKNGVTTWLADDNDANIYTEMVDSLDAFSFNHRKWMKQKFLGKSDFTREDVWTAIKEDLRAQKDDTIKGYNLELCKIYSATGKELKYDVAVIPYQGIVFILPTVVGLKEE